MKLPPYNLITTPLDWRICLEKLQSQPRLAIDLEANSMHAYREQVCLIQISIPGQDYIIDPLIELDLSGLGQLIADSTVEKVFHAAEYDLTLLKRQYDWDLRNLFDTMWAARILGYRRYGLASLLRILYQVQLNKRYQKSNWCKRPLSSQQLSYAQLDTHYLLRLRDHLAAELEDRERMEEARETFVEQSQVELNDNEFDPESFWSINGVHELSQKQQSVLRALNIYRDQEAEWRNKPLFKIFNDGTLLQLANHMPTSFSQLRQIQGMTPGQVRRYGKRLLDIIDEAKDQPPMHPPKKRNKRPPETVANRYEKLHNWRKIRAQARGVESDVIVSREALWAIARTNPKTVAELAQIECLGSWRCQKYGVEIIELLQEV